MNPSVNPTWLTSHWKNLWNSHLVRRSEHYDIRPLIIPTLLFPSFLCRNSVTRNNSYEPRVRNRARGMHDTGFPEAYIARSAIMPVLGFHGAVLFRIQVSTRSFFIIAIVGIFIGTLTSGQ